MTDQLHRIGAQTFLDAYEAFFNKEDLNSYIISSFSKQLLLEELAHQKIRYFLLYINGKAGGYLKLRWDRTCTCSISLPSLELERIYVLKEFYRMKTGRYMLERTIAFALNNQFRSIHLGVWQENKRAIEFYTANGFNICGIKKFQLGSYENDDFIMSRAL